MAMENRQLAKYIDHTALKAQTTPDRIRQLCEEAKGYGFYAVCVNSCYAALARECLQGSCVKLACVVGFPLGQMSTAAKAFEAKDAVNNGAQEIDMVLNVGWLKAGQEQEVREDIAAVVQAAKPAIVKVILETCYLTEEETVRACGLAKAAGASYVKTSTGFGSGGATKEDVARMRRSVGPDMGVKASGGIRTREDAEKMIEAGASRIGTSAGVAMMESI